MYLYLMVGVMGLFLLMASNGCATPDRSDLTGSWLIQLDPDSQGDKQKWHTQPLGKQAIQLPGTTDLGGYGKHNASLASYAKGQQHYIGAALVDAGEYGSGQLVREYQYIGKAWYQRTIDIPKNWQGKVLTLNLERCLWATRVYLKRALTKVSCWSVVMI